jgi:hypothetical protein
MSAVFDTLKQEAREREETGFITMRPDHFGQTFEGGELSATLNRAVVSSGAALDSIIVAYRAGKAHRVESMWWDVEVDPPYVWRSDTFFVRLQGDAATMGGGAVLVGDFEAAHERGTFILKLPRKTIHSEQVSFYTSKLKRKAPRLILGGRDFGEENA